MKPITNIISFISSLEELISPWHVIVDKYAGVHYISKSCSEESGYNLNNLKSFFQLCPEIDFATFSKVFEKGEKEELSTRLYYSDKQVDDTLSIVKIASVDVEPFLIIQRCERKVVSDKSQQLDSVTANKVKKLSSPLDYDKLAHNPIFYFNQDGLILYENESAKQLKLNGKSVIDEIFLEGEMGSVTTSIKALDIGRQETIVRMIMKSAQGMIDGFCRMSTYEESGKMLCRLEFLNGETLQLVDAPLEEAMKELNRLKSNVKEYEAHIIESHNDQHTFQQIISQSKRYKEVLTRVAQVADTDTTVLITGETGTGKELLANAIYNLSDRSDRIFVKVNCASIPTELIESTLFGHEKGAFTGASDKKIGKFELADGGTIFLDEIGELPIHMQPKLLRVLQEGEIERVGNASPIKVNVRIIAATNRNLSEEVDEGRFRSDLYYRLNVFPIHNMPLRDRKEDIELLVDHFISMYNSRLGRSVKKIEPNDMKRLQVYDYPGNIRELQNIIERSMIISKEETLNLSIFNNSSNSVEGYSEFPSLEKAIKEHIISALKLANGKVTGQNSASTLLNINGKTLVSKIKKLNINVKEI